MASIDTSITPLSISPGEGSHSHEAYRSDRMSYGRRAQDFVELHDQVQTSVNLLDSLENFLSTFQKDLSAVSGQISTLQDRSKDIENKLKSRRKIEKPLSHLLVDLCISPELATLILDTPVGEPWIPAIVEFENRLDAVKVRVRVKAARDLAEVAEGLRIVAATKLRTFFLAMLQPIRSSMTTNMQVIQTSVLLKYRSLFEFLQRHAPPVASEVQRAYVGTARTYFETGFRRYIRSLGYLKARWVEKNETIIAGAGETNVEPEVDVDRFSHSRIDGPGPVLAYMVERGALSSIQRKTMLQAAVRSVARSALRPSSVAVRALSTTPARRSGGGAPQLFGPGAKPGEVATDDVQATGLERIQVLGEKEGIEVFDFKPLESSRIGTLADPIKVLSWEPNRIIGCTGSPAESHELLWMNLTAQKNRRCPECGSVYALDYNVNETLQLHEH